MKNFALTVILPLAIILLLSLTGCAELGTALRCRTTITETYPGSGSWIVTEPCRK